MGETLAEIGEFGLIDRIHCLLEEEGVEASGMTLGIGDDTASFRPRAGYELLVTCDSLVEGQHYLPQHTTPLELGRRAMAINVSDIGAMGGHPLYALASLGLRAGTLVEDVESLYRGFIEELNPLGAALIGGNLTKTADAVFIDITLIGEVEPDRLVRRSTARPGDVILVTGYPGQAAAGLKLLLRSLHPSQVLRGHPLVRAYIAPAPRVREGQVVARSGYATAMIDISDGFLGDLGHICQASRVGAALFQDKLPISEPLRRTAIELGEDMYQLFLKDSDDYELIITCPPERVEGIRSSVEQISDVPVTEVGIITHRVGELELRVLDGTWRRVTPAGWDHFADRIPET